MGRVGSVQYLDFDREADSLADAVVSAMSAVEGAVPGLRVVQLEPDDLVTMSDIAQRTGRTRESIRLLIAGERGPGGFPVPFTHFGERQRMWRWGAVAAWFASELGESRIIGDPGRYQFTTLFNARLAWREIGPHLPAKERDQIRRAVGAIPVA